MSYRETDKRKQVSLLKKGLIIICLPLVFEVLFVMVLMNLLRQSSEHITAEMRSQDKIVCVETIIKEIVDSTVSAIIFNVTRREDFKKRNDDSRAKLMKTYSKLNRLVKDDKTEIDATQRFYNATMGFLAQQDKALNSGPKERMSAFFFIPAFSEAQQLLVLRPDGAARIIIDKEERIQSTAPKQRKQNIFKIEILLMAGFGLYAAFTIFLAMYFARYISERLNNVLTNTLKLGARMELDPPLRGNDEISELDHVLHSTASEILAFEKFKEQLVAVVSHELRTPLTSVQGTLTLLEAGAMGEFPEKSMPEIQRAQDNLKQLIDLVNNLLLLERLEAGSQVIKDEPVKIDRLVLEVLESRQDWIEEKGLMVQCNLEEIDTVCDAEKLKQALEILIDTSLWRAIDNSKVTFSSRLVGDRIELTCSDKGTPIETIKLSSYFDRTRDLDENDGDKSRILLLALSKSIIVAHGGSLAATSTIAETSFIVKIPLKRAPS